MAALLLCTLIVSAVPRGAGAHQAPGQAAETLRAALVDAQLQLIDDPLAAQASLQEAANLYNTALAPSLSLAAPESDERVRQGLDMAAKAVAVKDAPAFAAARAQVWTAVLDGSYRTVQSAIAAGNGADARAWLAVREFRQATRFSRPDADATLAVARLEAGEVAAGYAFDAVRADLLDTYQARLNEALSDLPAADAQGFASRRAEAAGLAEGYFAILAPAYEEQRGLEATATARLSFARLRADAVAGLALEPALAGVQTAIEGFRAAPLSPDDQVRRAGQMLRFLSLVPVEYSRGIRNGQVAKDLEIREAITFHDGASAAFADLRTLLAERDPAATLAVAGLFATVQKQLSNAGSGIAVANPSDVQATADELTAALQALMPVEWRRHDSSADFDVIDTALDQMQRAVAAGDYTLAESARLEAYAILESGPEARLVAFAPKSIAPIEDLFWYGQGEQPGLAFLLERQATRAGVAASRQALDVQLAAAQKALSGNSAPAAVATNAAIIVFREGLEAVIILAALMASLVGVNRSFRRPMVAGVLLALVATAATWWLAQQVLTTFSRYGERLEAVVSLIAIGMLLLITNWFFHQVYWKDHLAGFHARKKALMGSVAAGQILGFVLLGFSSVYREGFETVLFLQALVLESGLWTVLEGVAIGAILVMAVGFVTFKLQSRLPFKRMLVGTGILIGAVLLVMVGNTTHALQVVGWLPTHPIRWLTVPYWSGLWFGFYPTWEGVALQISAAVFVIGSYYLAEHKRGSRTSRATPRRATAATPAGAKAGQRTRSTDLAPEPGPSSDAVLTQIAE